MSYQVTARKWRPMIFDDVIGQGHVTNTLRNAIASNRVAHAYIFSGTRGCGKTTTARILARALNCLSPSNQNPDNTCDVCKEIIESRSMDVIEIDGASNRGVEEIRNLRDSVRYTPTRGKYKIYIIDEVHMLTKEAFNALLKTLEEPPVHVVFVFATTEVHKVPMTILSRCQRFDFLRIAIDEIVASISAIAKAEEIDIEDDALTVIAKRADGSLRDAQSIFDQVRSFCGSNIKTVELLKAFNVVDQEIYFRVSDLLKNHDARGMVNLIDEVIKSGYDLREFVGGLAEHLRNLLIVRSTESTKLVEASEHYKKRYVADANQFTEQDLLRYIKLTNELDQALRWASQPRYRLESGLIQMVKMESSIQISDMIQQIELLKKKLSSNGKTISPIAQINSSRSENPPTVDLKVVGEVGAGYLKSKSAMSYSSLIGSDLTKLAGTAKLSEVPIMAAGSPVVLQTVSTDEVAQRWSDFVSGVSKSHIAVGATLMDTQIIDVHNGMVRIACPDDYHFSTLKRHRDFLSDALHQIVGKRVVIEPVLHSNTNIPVKAIYKTISSTPTNELIKETQTSREPSTVNEHPILTILKRELGAERLE
jgi:DNA polymerase III subunit gamma/tau